MPSEVSLRISEGCFFTFSSFLRGTRRDQQTNRFLQLHFRIRTIRSRCILCLNIRNATLHAFSIHPLGCYAKEYRMNTFPSQPTYTRFQQTRQIQSVEYPTSRYNPFPDNMPQPNLYSLNIFPYSPLSISASLSAAVPSRPNRYWHTPQNRENCCYTDGKSRTQY